MVMAHVYAHVDFFKNNYAFRETNRNMLNVMADHGEVIDYYINKVGFAEVERFIDVCLSLENLIDPHSVRFKREAEESCKEKPKRVGHSFKAEDYMEHFIKTTQVNEENDKKENKKESRNPPEPQRDVLQFILRNSDKLKGWQKDILSIIREEAYYFAPQAQTKILNEGWATYWHSYMMATKRLAGDAGLIDYAKTHSGVIHSGLTGINPYRLGFLLLKDIKERWDKGRHGPDYENEKDIEKRKSWDTHEMKGLEKLFEVRRTKNDIEFFREFLTDDFIRDNLLFIFKLDPSDNWYKIAEREPEKIRSALLSQMTNLGEPIIEVYDGNFHNSKELLLSHRYDGRELKPYERDKTLENVYALWQRPVYLKTVENEKPVIFCFNGKEHSKLKAK